MIKIKTFIYKTAKRYFNDLNASEMDKEINNFTEKHKAISVTPVTYIEGIEGSFPVPVIMYTVVYDEAK